ncbi:MAG: nucleotide pyrophosphohydrolase [Nitrospinota bacterium]|nr:nucleotide pyrophosphohydrolase [Nitrospinota bacterium]
MSGGPAKLENLNDLLRRFAKERNWEQFHSPKNLSMALAGEAAEIMEIFQWLSEEQSRSLNAKQTAMLTDEIGDVLIYLVMLADKTGVDILSAAEAKLEKNRTKYPAPGRKDESGEFTEFG